MTFPSSARPASAAASSRLRLLRAATGDVYPVHDREPKGPDDAPVGLAHHTGLVSAPVPPGWPEAVPPPEAQGWQVPAVSWLLDHCPPDYRSYAAWRRHPLALAWVAGRHIDAQLVAMRQAYRDARVELGDHLGPEALADILHDLELEGVRLLAARRAAGLLEEAMRGKRFVPRL